MSKQQTGPDATGIPAEGAGTDAGVGPEASARAPVPTGPGGRQPRAGEDRESAVAEYLCNHPDFFERHAEVLALMRIRHDAGDAVSLIEHQVAVLRHQLDTERGRLAHLISRARGYETLSTRHHDLVLHIIPAADLDRLYAVLHDMLLRDFNAEAVALKLFPVEASAPAGAGQDPLVAAFRDFLARPHALCGPLSPEQGRFLFGETGAELGSAVLVPIRAGGRSGVLAIGASDPERFGPDMRTDLLDRLGEVVGAKLRTLPTAPAEAPAPPPKRAPRAKARVEAAVKTPRPSKPKARRAAGADAKSAPKAVPQRASRRKPAKTTAEAPAIPADAETAGE